MRNCREINSMKNKILLAVCGCCLAFSLAAQSDPGNYYRNFPLIISLQFHSLSLPFKHMNANFSNVGIGLGTEVGINNNSTMVQQLSMVWYHNKAVGNGVLFYTQSAWRPTLGSQAYSEFKLGVGYLATFRPVESYRQVKGEWVSAAKKGKGLLTIPVGISVGYNNLSAATYLSPFVSYQFLLINQYSKSIPLVPATLIQVGSRIHFK